MITVRKAELQDVSGIIRVCSDGWWATYQDMYPTSYIERVINEFYNEARITAEVTNPEGWDGWFVAVENDQVVGAGGGGMTGATSAEIFVLYVDPKRLGEGIGSRILDAITELHKLQGATEQWVSVAKGNQKCIPSYEARGFLFHSEQSCYRNTTEENYIACRYVRKMD
jgi:GNAT superfamily N-acetyltransferase